MKKVLSVVLVSLVVVALAGCSSTTKGSSTIKGTYSIHVSGYDWGAGVAKTIVSLDAIVDKVEAKDFVVTETKQATDFTDTTFPVKEVTVDRQVTDAYLCDEEGNKTDKASKYVALELYVSPDDGSPLLYSMSTQFNSWSNPYMLNITLAKDAKLTSNSTEVKEFTVDTKVAKRTTDADVLKTDSFKASNGTNYQYGYYEAKEKTDTLVVWLHGMGEGGTKDTDPYVASLANKVTALMGDEFQKEVGNANILVPQCPTFWMDPTGKGLGETGKIENDGTSYYVESLKELIDYQQKETGAKKVVLAGCSNGGFMVMKMAIAYPDAYDAIVPICEALADEFISDQDLQKIKDIPMYFIYSNDDDTVVPAKNEIPTIARLKAMGAKNLHVSTSESVIDTSGKYKGEDGNPHKYSGHWSWIYFDNNESNCDECDTEVWRWIGEQVK